MVGKGSHRMGRKGKHRMAFEQSPVGGERVPRWLLGKVPRRQRTARAKSLRGKHSLEL